tara:strand:+ start:209 stop:778 length:570 start_codon:yes stop_codon:yes gene_type:complete
MTFSNTFYDIIFSDFLISTKIDVSLDKLKNEIYDIRDESDNNTRSGRNSFQSSWCEDTDKEELQLLRNHIIKFANDFASEKFNTMEVDMCTWWVNINPPNGYNVIHNHGNIELVGNFYVQNGKEYGQLEILRNDGSVYNRLGRKLSTFKCDCEVGRFYMMPGHLWHYVSNNYSDEDRISISYNIGLKTK